MTGTVLDKIKAYKLEDVARRKANRPLSDVEDAARAAPPVRGFAAALETASQMGYGLIAEIKKASPSKGLIREDFNPKPWAPNVPAQSPRPEAVNPIESAALPPDTTPRSRVISRAESKIAARIASAA